MNRTSHAPQPSRRRPVLRGLRVAGILLLGAVAVLTTSRAAPPAALAGQSDFAGLVEIGGGRRMYLECRGQGSPTVILVSGYGNHGRTWGLQTGEVPQPQVMPAVAGFTRVCAYDRPGTVGFDLDDPTDRSRSDPVPQPRAAQETVADLHALLRAAAVPGPYVLVGHSLGGLYTRLYASTYPDEVAGMVLVDAISERFRAVLRPEEWDASLEIFDSPSMLPQLAAYRDYERINFDAVFDESLRAAAARPLRPMPLVVLSAGHVPDTSELGLALPPGFQEAFTAAARANQAFQARLLPDARQVIVTEAGHYIHVEQPRVVIDAIRQVVEAVRDPAAWGSAATGGVVARPVESGGGRMADDQYTAIIQAVPSPPRWFKGADDRFYLVYELLLTNTVPLPVTVTAVEVRDAESGAAVAKLSGAALGGALSLLAGDDAPGATLPPSTVGVVWLDLSFADQSSIPAAVEHRVTIGLPPGLSVPPSITATGGRAEVDRRAPVVLGPPLLGPRWLAAGSCCDGPHRRSLFALNSRLFAGQRFAIDFNLLDAEGRIAANPLSVNTNHAGFGQSVIAVADATVVTVIDRFPDQIEGDHYPATLENTPGNHVILDLGEGRFAFYAHLKLGTVAVREGERVRRGQQIGELGNSGNSGGAHLHFHVMDRPSPLAADGLPYVFEAFDLTGHGPPLAELVALYEAGQPLPIDTRGAGPRRDALPLGGDVVAFPR